ncbi:glycosyltransferase family 31 protein [Hypomontagnella monticulosa]|nr:glycosyltransferase family 31 protein [Hypomontagnella monticulosa]
MAILKQTYIKIALIVATFLALLLASKRIVDWSLQTSSLGIPSLDFPHHSAAPDHLPPSSDGNNPKYWGYPLSPIPVSSTPSTSTHGSVCNSFPDTSNILVIVKTGASESFAKVPTQLVTVLRCVSDFLVFSDMEQTIAGHYVHDSLQTVMSTVKESNPNFGLYHKQKACVVDQQNCHTEGNQGKEFDAWSLDKYKNVHIIEKTYKLRPNYDWYVFIDADTYVLWNNLVQWLGKLGDPSTSKRYLGSVAVTDDLYFAHGGSGYILSQATMQDLAENHTGFANKYDATAETLCCGDFVLAVALNETIGLGVEQSWPTINGENPYTIPYGSREWCHPLGFEKRFYESRSAPHPTIRFKDIFHEFIAPKLTTRRDDWDNLSEDVLYINSDHSSGYTQWQRDHARPLHMMLSVPAIEYEAYKSFEYCRRMCDGTPDCFQFSYHAGACTYHKSFKLGKPAAKTDNEEDKWISGWNMDRIRAWVEGHQDCKDPVWPNV